MVFGFVIVKSIRNALASASCCRMRCSEKAKTGLQRLGDLQRAEWMLGFQVLSSFHAWM